MMLKTYCIRVEAAMLLWVWLYFGEQPVNMVVREGFADKDVFNVIMR